MKRSVNLFAPLALVAMGSNTILLADALGPQKLLDVGGELTFKHGLIGFQVFFNFLLVGVIVYLTKQFLNIAMKQVRALGELSRNLEGIIAELKTRPCLAPVVERKLHKFGDGIDLRPQDTTEETPV